MKDLKEFIKSVLSANKGSLSSKRVCGLIGFAVLIIVWVALVVHFVISGQDIGQKIEEYMEVFTWAIVALLGVDSVTSIWKKGE